MRDDVVGFQGQVSCSAHSNANEIKLIHRPQHSQWQGIGCQRGLLNPTYVPNIKWAERLSGPNTLFQGKLFAPFGDISLLGPASHDTLVQNMVKKNRICLSIVVLLTTMICTQ